MSRGGRFQEETGSCISFLGVKEQPGPGFSVRLLLEPSGQLCVLLLLPFPLLEIKLKDIVKAQLCGDIF